jgi:hypothetical protein
MPATFSDFREEYQEMLLACMMQEPDALAEIIHDIKPKYFTGVQPTLTARCIVEHHAKYRRVPSWTALEQRLDEVTRGMPESEGGLALDYVRKLRDMDCGDWKFVRDNFGKFLQERALVDAIRQTVTLVQDGKIPPEGFVDLFAKAMQVGQGMPRRLEAARLKPGDEPPPEREVFLLNGVVISTPGNLTNIVGLSKAGKSGFIGGMLGATMADPRDEDYACDCLGVTGYNASGHAVVHLDTEQSHHDHGRGVQTSWKRRAQLNGQPDWLLSYWVTGWSVADRRLGLEVALKVGVERFGAIHSVFIDGVADFVNDPNDGEECFAYVDSLQALAIRYDCPIVCGLHLNPSGGETYKTRGHLGSHLERRAESNLILEKDESGRTCVFSGRQRHAPIPKADGPCFRWDDAAQMHVSTATLRSERDAASAKKARELCAAVFADDAGPLAYPDIIAAIMATASCGRRTADTRLGEMKAHGMIVRFPPNLWAPCT